MYEKHFGLTERPFSIAPDPRFLYMSQQHREALAHLLYGVGEGGGFVQLTGEVGTGKTTICRCLLEQLPENVDVALILNPRVTALELLASLCDELRIRYDRDTTSIKSLIDVLNAYLLESHARGRRTVLMIDEAQNLGAEALEQVRLLTNLETTREKLLQIILVGQPELRDLLAREDLRQLSQRITARYHLTPIHRDETAAYIQHRLQVCGATVNLFDDNAIDMIQKLSGGVPRLINVLCDRAMLGAYVEGSRSINAAIVHKAATEVLPEQGLEAPRRGLWRWFAATAAVLAAGLLAWFLRPPAMPPGHADRADSMVQIPSDEAQARKPETTAAAGRLSAPAAVAGIETPEPAATAAVADGSTLDALLARAGTQAAARAWAALYRLWGLSSSAVNDEQACAQAPSVGLRCLQGGGSWTVLQRYDRPAVLLLTAPDGRRVPVLLSEVMGANVRIQVDGHDLEVPLAELKRHWLGEYRLLWKVPPGGSPVLRPGERSPDVEWLRERLQQVTGLRSIAPDPQRFDAGLRELVRSFQQDHGLDADGVAGPRTLIYLNNLTGESSMPRLGVVASRS
ncbi:MAG TPA: hypothetical protein ENK05_11380 [Gammaproteobacteria bacterium]|nr:hypothetical protein [Gammaproteobacteria bacterium]